MADETKLSPVEEIKSASRFLRGSIAEDLADAGSDQFAKPNTQLLKFHGTYQQDDRDERAERFRSLVAGKRILVVDDGVRSEQQILPLLPGSRTCAVIVATVDARRCGSARRAPERSRDLSLTARAAKPRP